MGLLNFFQNFYKAIQYNNYSKDRLLKIQEQRFERLLRYAVKYSDFYRELYRGIDINSCSLQDLPVITKSVMMENFDRLVTDSRLKLSEIYEWTADKNNFGKLFLDEFLPIPTSGSTGEYALVVYYAILH